MGAESFSCVPIISGQPRMADIQSPAEPGRYLRHPLRGVREPLPTVSDRGCFPGMISNVIAESRYDLPRLPDLRKLVRYRERQTLLGTIER